MAAEPGGTTARTRLLVVLGHPISHSLSPVLHSAAIADAGLDAVYVAADVAPECFDTALAGLRALGFLGANVTIPHKQAALRGADGRTEEASFIGAANTLFWDGDVLMADNTDAAGLQTVLTADCGVVAGDLVTIVGSGGAALAAAVACGRLGARTGVHARRPQAAIDVADLAVRAGGQVHDGQGDPRVVINATPLGRKGESLPSAFMGLGAGRVALDLNYGTETPFLASARQSGGRAVDGLGMLIGQAEAAFARWTGERPRPGVMAAAVGRSEQ